MADEPEEMDMTHRLRVSNLLDCAGKTYGMASHDQIIAAYQAVLTKDLLWATTELLTYKQQEVHR